MPSLLEYHLSSGIAQTNGCELYYELHSLHSVCESADEPPAVRVLLVMGLAATAACWQPQIQCLCQQAQQLGQPLQVCAFDNRGVGRSSSPMCRQAYSSEIMAADALALMDSLQWQSAHVCGFSMGTQISLKLAAAAPSRVRSLTLVAAAGGGWRVLPRSLAALRGLVRALLARTPEQRAAADLRLHFTSRVLQTQVRIYTHQPGGQQLQLATGEQLQLPAVGRQKDVLVSEYVALAAALPPQPQHGAAGQMHAVWSHRLSRREKRVLATAAFPKLFIHGRSDLVAAPGYAHKLSEELGAPFVELPGAHFVTREAAQQVNSLLAGMVLHAPTAAADGLQQTLAQSSSRSGSGSCRSSRASSCGKLQQVHGSSGGGGGSSGGGSIAALFPHEQHLALAPIVPPAITSFQPAVVVDARCC